jgi:hypothetical protein
LLVPPIRGCCCCCNILLRICRGSELFFAFVSIFATLLLFPLLLFLLLLFVFVFFFNHRGGERDQA